MMRKVREGATVAIALLLVLQLVVAWRSFISPLALKVWRIRERPAWERTAIVLLGTDHAGFISFLRETIPEDARVILPGRKHGTLYEHVGIMQYFLNPRDIHNCGRNETNECVQRASGENTYILAVGYFPPRELAKQTKHLISYDENRGIFAPK